MRRRNKIDVLLGQLDTGVADALNSALHSPAWSDERLAETLSRWGHDVGGSTVKRWRVANEAQRFSTTDMKETA